MRFIPLLTGCLEYFMQPTASAVTKPKGMFHVIFIHETQTGSAAWAVIRFIFNSIRTRNEEIHKQDERCIRGYQAPCRMLMFPPLKHTNTHREYRLQSSERRWLGAQRKVCLVCIFFLLWSSLWQPPPPRTHTDTTHTHTQLPQWSAACYLLECDSVIIHVPLTL